MVIKKWQCLGIGVFLTLCLLTYVFYKRVTQHVLDFSSVVQMTETQENSLKTHLFALSGSKKMILSTLKHYEVFEKKSELHLFNERLRLPDIIVRASMPVEYNYYVDFDGEWFISVDDLEIKVIAPSLQVLPPSVALSELEFEVKKGSLFRRDSVVLDALRSELDELLNESAQSYVPTIQETARRELKQFVELWAEGHDKGTSSIKIIFKDEVQDSQPF